MKLFVVILSSLAMGLISAINDYSPIAELHSLLTNKRRLIASVVVGAAGFFLVMAAIITAGIEGALQFEVQGFLLWSALFQAAAGFAILGLVCAVGAKLLVPKPAPPALSWTALDKKFQLTELLEKWMQQASAKAHEAAAPRPEPPPASDLSATAYHEREAATHH